MALMRHKAKVTIFVPHYALSGGTLLCLAANEVIMDENAVLGAGRSPIGRVSRRLYSEDRADEGNRYIEDKTLLLMDVAQKGRNQMRAFVKEILVARMDEKRAEELAATLTDGRWTHDYPISFEEAKSLGLHVAVGLPGEIYQPMDLFPLFQVQVDLAGLDPTAVRVELYADGVDGAPPERLEMRRIRRGRLQHLSRFRACDPSGFGRHAARHSARPRRRRAVGGVLHLVAAMIR